MEKTRRFFPVAALLAVVFIFFAAQANGAQKQKISASARAGQALVKDCLLCHTTTGEPLVGPSWKGIYGTKVTVLVKGKPEVKTVDEKYLRFMITNPNVWVVKGYKPVMTKTQLTGKELDEIIAYIKTLK